MAFFCAVIRRDSVSLLRFPFRSHVQVFLRGSSPVCRLRYSYICFSYHFFFLVFVHLFFLMLSALLLTAVISLSLLFLILSSSPRINAATLSSMLVCLLPPSFLAIYNLCHLSDIKPCASSSTFLSSDSFVWVSPLSILRMIPGIIQGVSTGVYPFDEISVAEFNFEKLSRSSEVLFDYFFLSSPLVW